ncbi:MAG: zinc ribbon domain-containing protein [Methanomassiliicoccaceae archaeon]|jgi:hypothetical protein|nr:zinc ribbon domain-containing protein [Methanomassiliicoccaceae archaeon]
MKLPSDEDVSKGDKPATEYTAQAASPIVNGEVKMIIKDRSFTVTALFDAVEMSFARVNKIGCADYVVNVDTDDGGFSFSRMGQWAQPFCDALCAAYNKVVTKAFFVSGDPITNAEGDYRFTENGAVVSGSKAPMYVYENCIVALPPNADARRIPLCFMTGMDKKDYEMTLSLNTGEAYTLARIGYATAPFADAIEKQIRALREKTLATMKELDPSLSAVQASQIAKLIPEGVAAPMGQLRSIAPSFAKALEAKIAGTRAAEPYTEFSSLCDPSQIWVGLRKNDMRQDAEKEEDDEEAEGQEQKKDPYLVWMIAPSRDGKYAAVEFAVADTATFVYRTEGNFNNFATQLNRALEAISFKREVIRMTDAELQKPENTDYLMAAKRTSSLQFIRKNFVGRVIHSGHDAWKRKLAEMWGGTAPQASGAPQTSSQAAGKCGSCGAEMEQGRKFCGSCGHKN